MSRVSYFLLFGLIFGLCDVVMEPFLFKAESIFYWREGMKVYYIVTYNY